MDIKKAEGIPDAIWVEPTAPGIPEVCSGIWEKFRSKDSDRYVGYTRTDIMQARIAELEAENGRLKILLQEARETINALSLVAYGDGRGHYLADALLEKLETEIPTND